MLSAWLGLASIVFLMGANAVPSRAAARLLGQSDRGPYTTGLPTEEAQFVSLINGVRANKGLAPYAVHEQLVAKARGWSRQMAEDGRIYHSNLADGMTVKWKRLGENVGVGPSVQSLHDAFVASSAHYANLVHPSFNYVGVGITTTGDGTIFVSQNFMELQSSPSPTTTAPRPATTSTTRATRTTRATAVPRTTLPAVTTVSPPTTAPTTTAPTTTAPRTAVAAEPVAQEPRHGPPLLPIVVGLVGLGVVAVVLSRTFARQHTWDDWQ